MGILAKTQNRKNKIFLKKESQILIGRKMLGRKRRVLLSILYDFSIKSMKKLTGGFVQFLKLIWLWLYDFLLKKDDFPKNKGFRAFLKHSKYERLGSLSIKRGLLKTFDF